MFHHFSYKRQIPGFSCLEYSKFESGSTNKDSSEYNELDMKEASITFKTSPEIKKILERLAEDEFRSLSAQTEMIVVKYLKEQGHLKDKKK